MKRHNKEQRRGLRGRAGGPVIVCTMLNEEEHEIIHAAVTEINSSGVPRAPIRDKIDSLTTHVVAHTNKNKKRRCRSMKYFQAVAAGIIVVAFDWVRASRAAGKWLQIDQFEVQGGETD